MDSIEVYKKPKRRKLKIILLVILCLVLGAGVWLGITFYSTLKKVTAFSSGGNNSLWSLVNKNTTLKGQNEGRTNILLLGYGGAGHSGAYLSDTIQVLSIDWKTNQLALLSIPRDLWVNIPGYGYAKINEACSYGQQNSKTTGGCGNEASTVIGQILGIPIHYFVTLDFNGFTDIVKTIGGVDVNVPTAFTDRNYPAGECNDRTGVGCGYKTVHFDAGPQHLDADNALIYARSRESTSDFDRSKRQQLVMEAIKTKVMSLDILANPSKISSLLNSVGNHVGTNLSIGEIKAVWDEIKQIDTANIINKVIDNSAKGVLNSSTSTGGASILIPKKGIGKYQDLQAIAQNIFNDANAPKIEVLNGSGKTATLSASKDKLQAAGIAVTDDKTAAKKYTSTLIYNCSGDKFTGAVQKIISAIGGTAQSSNSCDSYDIEIILGQDQN